MAAVDRKVIALASDSWRKVCDRFNVRIVAPYMLEVEGDSAMCIAFLSDFGGPNGMVIGAMDLPQVGTDQHLGNLAKRKGLYCSFVNASAFARGGVDEKVFKEALEDWGYYGPQDKCPAWFSGYKGGRSLP
jgi:hypothetical protein